jgi:tRNA uridine 5-carbamoylmethylation protein Kti12
MCMVTIFRGLPGSGKSTMAARSARTLTSSVICSADDYFMVNGEYRYEPRLLKDAHRECLLKFLTALQEHSAMWIAVDNTNITTAEIAPYYALAEVFKAHVEIFTINCSVDLALSRNIHHATANTVMDMFKRLEVEDLRFPSHWNRHFQRAET